MSNLKIKPLKRENRQNLDRVVSFRLEGRVVDFLESKGIDFKASAREYLREVAKEAGLTTDEIISPESRK